MTTWQRSPAWIGSPIEDSFVMVDIDSGKYVELNGTASAVWDMLAEPVDEGTIAVRLQEAYNVDAAVCRASVRTLIDRLAKDDMVQPVG